MLGRAPSENEGERNQMRRRLAVSGVVAVAVAAVTLVAVGSSGSATRPPTPAQAALGKINHIVVIYEENHSFDNLYGGWEGVNGRSSADAAHTVQVSPAGLALPCLLQDDVT